jgi:hypothetical protein
MSPFADAMEAAAKRQLEAEQNFKGFNEVLQLGGNIAGEAFCLSGGV